MSDKPSSDKPLYDELMNLTTEIGELEVENKELKKWADKLIKECSVLNETNSELMAGLIEYNQATFKKRLRYLFTGEMGGGE